MNTKEINTIISKYLDDEATVSEETFLLEWIKNNDNRTYFEDFIRTQTWVTYNYDSSIIDKQLNALSIDSPMEGKPFGGNLLKYAAMLIAICSTAFLVYDTMARPDQPFLNKDIISLEVNNGTSIYYSLENPDEFLLRQEGTNLKEAGVLEYRPTTFSYNETHTIHVPYGKTFKVVLSDGSVVQLNSGSRFSYPASFDGRDSRSVSLVGEGYFDIAKSIVPFRVKTQNLTTEVLGTVFNISAYEDELEKEVILIEGSVQLVQDAKNSTYSKTLMPNQKAYALKGEELLIESIDISNHLGWTNGVLVFYKNNMAAILKKLERKFNVRIENTYEKLESLSFSGKFSKNETLEEVLDTMRAHTDFSYSITEKNTLIIYEPDNIKSL